MDKRKENESKKQITFRLKPKTIAKLRKIDKFHSKVDEFINYGINEYKNKEMLENNKIDILNKYYEDKKWEYENIDIEHNEINKGILKGLEIALEIMNK